MFKTLLLGIALSLLMVATVSAEHRWRNSANSTFSSRNSLGQYYSYQAQRNRAVSPYFNNYSHYYSRPNPNSSFSFHHHHHRGHGNGHFSGSGLTYEWRYSPTFGYYIYTTR